MNLLLMRTKTPDAYLTYDQMDSLGVLGDQDKSKVSATPSRTQSEQQYRDSFRKMMKDAQEKQARK